MSSGNLLDRWGVGGGQCPHTNGTSPLNFEKDLAELVKLVERFADQVDPLYAMAHPILDKMSTKQWLRWGYTHTNHHLRQFGA